MADNTTNTFDERKNQKYEDWELPTFKPTAILKVTVVCCRNVSVGYWADMVDTPDPQVYLQCYDAVGIKEQNTTVKSNSVDAVWNEEFAFVLPSTAQTNGPSAKPIILKVLLYDEDSYSPDDFVGANEIDVGPMKFEETHNVTLKLGTANGELDLKIRKHINYKPTFRYSLGLCEGELAAKRERKAIVLKNMKKMFPKNHPQNINEVANVSVVGSGGGYRAYTSYAGAMEALMEEEIIGVSNDVYGLSGGAWYITSLMVSHGLDDYQKLREFHKQIKDVMATNLYYKLFDLPLLYQYKVYKKTKEIYKQPVSLVDLYGYIIGSIILGEDKLSTRLSDLQQYVRDGHVPFPTFTAIHVKDSVPASKFNAQVEMNPYEISIPSYALNIPAETYGCQWFRGCITRKCKQTPMHFLQGKTGSAFGIMFDKYLDGQSNETSKTFLEKFDHSRKNWSKSSGIHLHLEENESDEDEEDVIEGPPQKKEMTEDEVDELLKTGVDLEDKPKDEHEGFFKNALKNISFLKSRNFLVGRSAIVLNFARGMGRLPEYSLNPEHEKEVPKTSALRMNTKNKNCQFVDSAMTTNIPALSALRPQRNSNVLIVIDSSFYDSDDKIDYYELVNLARLAEKDGLKFPKFDREKMWASSNQEFHVLEDEDDLECPIVLWFTLCATAFRNLKHYQRLQPVPGETKGHLAKGEQFNDVSVLGNPAYTTFKLNYTALEFDRCKELMRHNVRSHSTEIKAAIARANARRKKLIAKAK